jgi:competence protein ComEA
MKTSWPWQSTLLGILVGLLLSAGILLISSPPKGNAIQLNPVPTQGLIKVYIVGAVKNPGVYSLPRLSRVADVVRAAGGLDPSADENAINLAAQVSDGEKIIIPSIQINQANPNTITPSPEPMIQVPSKENPININNATPEQLDLLPGIGPTRAQDIITYRDNNGPFTSTEDIQDVPGIGQTTFERIKDLITVGDIP